MTTPPDTLLAQELSAIEALIDAKITNQRMHILTQRRAAWIEAREATVEHILSQQRALADRVTVAIGNIELRLDAVEAALSEPTTTRPEGA